MLNFYAGGAHRPLAQKLIAVLLGGAIWHHAIGEGNPAHSVGALVFLAGSTALLAQADGLQTAALTVAACAAVGFGMGVAVGALSTPVKAAKKSHAP